MLDRYGSSTDNLFLGPDFYFTMMDVGILIPFWSSIRTAAHPVPDTLYVVGDDLNLCSLGGGYYNMSCINASKGVYDPAKVLKETYWSITGLQLSNDSLLI